jgi:hypothetical protein
MAHIVLRMPRCGEDGVLIATRGDGYVVEFRGKPYSQWEIGDDTPFIQIHSVLERVNISDLHCGLSQTVTSQPGVFPEWEFINTMFDLALQGASDADSRALRGR